MEEKPGKVYYTIKWVTVRSGHDGEARAELSLQNLHFGGKLDPRDPQGRERGYRSICVYDREPVMLYLRLGPEAFRELTGRFWDGTEKDFEHLAKDLEGKVCEIDLGLRNPQAPQPPRNPLASSSLSDKHWDEEEADREREDDCGCRYR